MKFLLERRINRIRDWFFLISRLKFMFMFLVKPGYHKFAKT